MIIYSYDLFITEPFAPFKLSTNKFDNCINQGRQKVKYYGRRVLHWLQKILDLLKLGYFEQRLHTLKVIQNPWTLASKQIWNGSFKWGTKHWFWSRSCKDTKAQSWRSKKICWSAWLNPCTRGRPSWQIFFSTSNFDL